MSQRQAEQGSPPGLYGLVTSKLAEYAANARNNIGDGLDNMTPQSWIRLVVIVGGYMLFRQYVIKHSTGAAVRKLEAQEAEEKRQRAEVSPNELRGLPAGEEEEEGLDADERADGSGADWGSRARVKQRKFVRAMLEQEEQRRMEEQDDDDADIKEFLLD